ncbi:LysM peptidoglycan-binding domain-containing protein [Verminephrobacter aporrectodeae subsp. tuberculatae]|uniref:LysM peptidoglycan-binding domain-containing protein n=2 Tax=Verminephrobacter TaxID=364316 RepID=A0ABT3KVB8_9BURK|nr:transglycosylase SLT domain-containing protein [Verminephrobacter aporrectodeae]MCW5322304.1 LysM peptidoglycan-binding domain-containing protein [Verminephrobacter aporrectodeae subsp. tuberculatae]
MKSKLLYGACLAGLLLLAGCATTEPQEHIASGGDPSAPGAASARGPQNLLRPGHASAIPDGPLKPIAAARAVSGEVASLSAPADLWERIRRGFAMPELHHPLVQDREQWYATRPDYMQRMTERSGKYLFHIVEELERRGMPTELALLPYIESAFNPQAISSAKAVGMWQFMPATGSYFDLKQNAFRDDRRDVLASTRAALDYLQKLYGMFGDWHLALAAYNWGEGSVGRAIARNQKLGLGSGYADLSMPAETRMYVPKLQAVKNIVANPEAFATELPPIGNHPYFQTVDITHDIDVALVATLAGVREEDFRALNPSFKRPVILAAGTPQILLPWDNAKVFQRNLQAHSDGQYASWTVWSVPATMSVAEAAQRAGMSERDLRSVNDIPQRMLIKAGSALMVPRLASGQDVSLHLADNGQIALTPEIVTRRTTVRAGKGETVAGIARRYALSAANVANWNGMRASAALKAGQSVVLYLPVRSAQAGSASRTSAGKRKAATAPARRGGGAPAQRGGTPAKVKRR